MAYASQSDLETRFGSQELIKLTSRGGSTVDAAVLDRAIEDAGAEIDAYLAVRYQLPLSNVPPVLGLICCDMARYFLYGNQMVPAVRDRYEDAVRRLKAISSGGMMLEATPIATAAPSSVTISSRTPERAFTADALARY
jgi:phage gp36-like protein